MLRTATIGELMPRDHGQKSILSVSLFHSRLGCIEMHSGFQCFFSPLRLFFFSCSLSSACPFNPSLATLSRRQLFYNPSLSRRLFSYFFFILFFFEIFSSPLAGFHYKRHPRPLTLCVCVCVFFTSVYLYPPCPRVCLSPPSLPYHFSSLPRLFSAPLSPI